MVKQIAICVYYGKEGENRSILAPISTLLYVDKLHFYNECALNVCASNFHC